MCWCSSECVSVYHVLIVPVVARRACWSNWSKSKETVENQHLGNKYRSP